MKTPAKEARQFIIDSVACPRRTGCNASRLDPCTDVNGRPLRNGALHRARTRALTTRLHQGLHARHRYRSAAPVRVDGVNRRFLDDLGGFEPAHTH